MRPGHTEVAVLLPQLAGLNPVDALVEIMNDDGTMARYPDLKKISRTLNIKPITIKDVINYLDNKNIKI